MKTHLDAEPIFEDILRMAKERRIMGAKQYGDLTFMNQDNLIEAECEMVDLVNYALFEIVKLRALREKIQNHLNNLKT